MSNGITIGSVSSLFGTSKPVFRVSRNRKGRAVESNAPGLQGEAEQSPIIETVNTTANRAIRTQNPKYCHPTNWVGPVDENDPIFNVSTSGVVYTVLNAPGSNNNTILSARGQPAMRVEECISNLDARYQIRVVGVMQNEGDSKGLNNGQDNMGALAMGGTREVNNTGEWIINPGDLVYALPYAFSIPGLNTSQRQDNNSDPDYKKPRISGINIPGVSPRKLLLQTVPIGPMDFHVLVRSLAQKAKASVRAAIWTDKTGATTGSAALFRDKATDQYNSLIREGGYRCFEGLIYWVMADLHLYAYQKALHGYVQSFISTKSDTDTKTAALKELTQGIYESSKMYIEMFQNSPVFNTADTIDRYQAKAAHMMIGKTDMEDLLKKQKTSDNFMDLMAKSPTGDTYGSFVSNKLVSMKDRAMAEIDVTKENYLLGRAQHRATTGGNWTCDIKKST